MGLSNIVGNVGEYFSIDELVHPDLLPLYSENTLWELFDADLLAGLYLLRQYIDRPIWINGRGRSNSGFRPCFSNVGATLSAHRTGHALDLHCSDIEELHDVCISNNKMFGFTEVENPVLTPSWCHISTRKRIDNKFHVINS